MDPDPAIFVTDLQDADKKLVLIFILSAFYFLKVYLHHFLKIKSQNESRNSRNQGFSNFFCMMVEGSGSRAGSISDYWIWIREAQKHVDTVDPDSDPDPQHWRNVLNRDPG
jgi:hypothetical protein